MSARASGGRVTTLSSTNAGPGFPILKVRVRVHVRDMERRREAVSQLGRPHRASRTQRRGSGFSDSVRAEPPRNARISSVDLTVHGRESSGRCPRPRRRRTHPRGRNPRSDPAVPYAIIKKPLVFRQIHDSMKLRVWFAVAVMKRARLTLILRESGCRHKSLFICACFVL